MSDADFERVTPTRQMGTLETAGRDAVGGLVPIMRGGMMFGASVAGVAADLNNSVAAAMKGIGLDVPTIDKEREQGGIFDAMDRTTTAMREVAEPKNAEGTVTGHVLGALANIPAGMISAAGGFGGIDDALDVIRHGGTVEDAARVGITQAAFDAATTLMEVGVAVKAGAQVAGAVAKPLATAAAGGATSILGSAAERAGENAALPAGEQFQDMRQNVLPTWKQAITEGGVGALFGLHGASEAAHAKSIADKVAATPAPQAGLSPADQMRVAVGLPPLGEPGKAPTGFGPPEAGPGEVEHIEAAPAPAEGRYGGGLNLAPGGPERITAAPAPHHVEFEGAAIPQPEPRPGTEGMTVHEGEHVEAAPAPPSKETGVEGMAAEPVENVKGAPAPKGEAPGLAPEEGEQIEGVPYKSPRQIELERNLEQAETPGAKTVIRAEIAKEKKIQADADSADEMRDLANQTKDPELAQRLREKADKLAPAAPPEKEGTAPTGQETEPTGGVATTESKPIGVGSSPFLRKIVEDNGGIHPSEAADLGLDPAKSRNIMIGGNAKGSLVRRAGARMDQLTEWAQQNGYLSEKDIHDADNNLPGGSHELTRQLIRNELAKPGSTMPLRDQSDMFDVLREHARQQGIVERAEQAGIETGNRPIEDIENDLYKHEDQAHVEGHGLDVGTHAEGLGDVHALAQRPGGEDLIERLAVKHGDDYDGFIKEVRENLNGNRTPNAGRGAVNEPGPGGANEKPAVRGEPEGAPANRAGENPLRNQQRTEPAEAGATPEAGRPIQPARANGGNEAAAGQAGKSVEPARPKFDFHGLSVNDAEKELRGLARPEQKGDVMLSNGDTVPFADAVRLAQEGIESGALKPNPGQLHFGLGLAMRDTARVLDGVREAQHNEAAAGEGKPLGRVVTEAERQRNPNLEFKGEAPDPKAAETMQLHTRIVKSVMDGLGLGKIMRNVKYVVDSTLAEHNWDGLATLYPDGSRKISINPIALVKSAVERIAHIFLHEHGHALDTGEIYSSDPALKFVNVMRDGKPSVEAVGQAAKEVEAIWKNHIKGGEMYDYPLKNARSGAVFPEGYANAGKPMYDAQGTQSEVFAQNFSYYNHPLYKEILRNEAPAAYKLIEDAIAHAKENGPLPEGGNLGRWIAGNKDTFALGRDDLSAARSAGRSAGGFSKSGTGLFEQVERVQPRPIEAARTEGPNAGRGEPEREPGRGSPVERFRSAVETLRQSPIVQKAQALAEPLIRDFQNKVSPMTTGSDRSQAMAKDFASAIREAAVNYNHFHEVLTENFTPEENGRMWEAGDEENDKRMAQAKLDADTKASPMERSLRQDQINRQFAGKGIDSLPPQQKAVMDFLNEHGQMLLDRARQAGMYEGSGVPYWTPRVAAMMGEDGELGKLTEGEGGGKSALTTTSPNLIGRKYETTLESEQALKAKFGTGAGYVKDIRVMPRAMARLERAIAGRELVNKIADLSQEMAMDPTQFTTFDHPALKSYRAEPQPDGTVKWSIKQRMVPKEFEGPLKAVLTQPSGAIYKGLLAMKNAATSIIMNSPFIHLGVEVGRALPVMGGKMATVSFWKDGSAMLKDLPTMRRFLQAGYVPIGRQNLSEDLGAMMREPELTPGRGITAKLVGGAVGLVNKGAGQAVKGAIDKAGDFVHGTLLWDRVAQLQAGIAVSLERQMIADGIDPRASTLVAAHIANRYAGALPAESISQNGRKIANLLMFSRSFTLGNLGAMKDTMTGLPQDVRAQLMRDVSADQANKALDFAKRKARMGLVADIGMLYGINAVAQAGAGVFQSMMKDNKDLPEALAAQGEKYSNILHDAMTRLVEHPVLSVLHPFDTTQSFLPQATNEPGKENRVLIGHSPDGTAHYMRIPLGKVGEEMQGWMTKPGEMLDRKLSTLAKPLVQGWTGDLGFGRQLYKPNDDAMTKAGKFVMNFMKAQVPADQIEATYRTLSGQGQDMDLAKTVGPLMGFTFSQGAPGGEAMGELYAERKEHAADLAEAAPAIKQAIKAGDNDQAEKLMDDAHLTPQEKHFLYHAASSTGPTKTQRRNFFGTATEDEKASFERAQEQ